MGDNEHAAVAAARELLGRQLRVTMKVGRVFDGEFYVLDEGCNLVLRGAREQLAEPGEGEGGERYMGLVMFSPGDVEKYEAFPVPPAPVPKPA